MFYEYQCNNCKYQKDCLHVDDVKRLEKLWKELNLTYLVKVECRKFQQVNKDN